MCIRDREGKELLDDVETPAVIFLLGNDERLEVTRVVSHEMCIRDRHTPDGRRLIEFYLPYLYIYYNNVYL